MNRIILILVLCVCPASFVRADQTVSVTWDLSKLVGSNYNNHSISATESNIKLTIVSGTFSNKSYDIGSQGSHTQESSTGYTENAVIHVPVFSTSDKITITCHYCCYLNVSCYNGDYGTLWGKGELYVDESFSKTFTPKPDDVTNGYVEITCQKNSAFSNLGTFFTSITASYSSYLTSLILNDGESFQSDVDLTVEDLTFKRTFTNDGGMYTLMVPFDIYNPSEYGTFYEYASHSGETVTLNEVATPRANTPYIFKPTKDFTEIRQTNTTIHATIGLSSDKTIGLHGTYEQITAPTGGYGYSAGDVSGISAGAFVRIGTNVTLPPYRAYLWLGETSAVRLRVEFSDLSNDEATSIKSVSDDLSVISHPFSRLRTSEASTISGQAVTPGYKGIVIINGKKLFIR